MCALGGAAAPPAAMAPPLPSRRARKAHGGWKAEAGHTSPLTGGEVFPSMADGASVRRHSATARSPRGARTGVSRSAHACYLILAAAASQPLHWPGVACGSFSGRVLVVFLNARLARVVRYAGKPQRPAPIPCRSRIPAIGPGQVGGAGYRVFSWAGARPADQSSFARGMARMAARRLR